jgi:hypothetical protein
MWSEWLKTENSLGISEPPKMVNIPHDADVPSNLEKLICKISEDHLNKRGQVRFKKDIIDGLITGEKDLYWFRDRLSRFDPAYSDDTYWERFTTQEGYSIKTLRLFQFSLILINYFREQVFKGNAHNRNHVCN